VDEDLNQCGEHGGWKMPITLETESVNVKPGTKSSHLYLTVNFQIKGKLSNGQEIDIPIVFNVQDNDYNDGMKKARDLLKELGSELMKSADRA
jgi:hypothetical protein